MELLKSYWSVEELITNALILAHLMGAFCIGCLIGYERSYHGRAAGIRTYSLVCIATTALTIVCAYPDKWFGGHAVGLGLVDPTRVVQGIMTGIGFLGAGVIMKEGFSIRGLSTAASIWMTAAIGVLIGLGFYGASIAAALLTILLMSGVRGIENALPHQKTMHLSLSFPHDRAPSAESIRQLLVKHGYDVSDWTFQLADLGQRFQFEVVLHVSAPLDPSVLVAALNEIEGIEEFRLSPSRG